MSDFTAVNAGQMQQGISDLNTAHKGTDSTLTQLEGELEQSLAQWDGQAREAYQAAKQKWDAAANHMAQVIQKMTTTLSTISENYDANERNITSSWS
ncbi:WXG100 family type VII secretion target [Microlunatus sp. Y2014]|uniref:WXG100 family type VII secretion target n=1 Tax=Microlunatus sp. Y2014 TaxID=3418488 RepID=UPI003DA6EF2F